MPARDPGSSPRRPRSGSSSPLSSPTGPWSSFAARMLSSSPHPINIEPSSSVIINSEHAAASPPNHGDVSTSYKRVLSLGLSRSHQQPRLASFSDTGNGIRDSTVMLSSFPAAASPTSPHRLSNDYFPNIPVLHEQPETPEPIHENPEIPETIKPREEIPSVPSPSKSSLKVSRRSSLTIQLQRHSNPSSTQPSREVSPLRPATSATIPELIESAPTLVTEPGPSRQFDSTADHRRITDHRGRFPTPLAGVMPTDMTPLLTDVSLPSYTVPHHGLEPEARPEARRARSLSRHFRLALSSSIDQAKTATHPGFWSSLFYRILGSLPAVFLGTLLNILDGVSYGMIMFPAGKIFDGFGPMGVSLFFVTTIIAQLVYTFGGSSFPGGNGSMMIEVVPFFNILTAQITQIVGEENEAAVIATTLASFSFSAILTGTTFFILGKFRLGNLIGFFPRHILVGCIGGVGWFLIETGFEVATGMNEEGGFQYNLETLKFFFGSGRIMALWMSALGLAVTLRIITEKFHHQLIFPIYFILIPAVFYIVVAAGHFNLDQLRQTGWLFNVGDAHEPWWKIYTYWDFQKISWIALLQTMPTQFALLFFNILHPPLNVPALAVSLDQEVDTNRELVAHGYSNVLAGLAGTTPNYLVYVNTVLFYRVGGVTRLAGFLLACSTAVVMIAGTTSITYLPVMVVGALIFVLGIDLVREAVWDTRHRVSKTEYVTILSIIVCMTVFDFVIGVLFGIVLACFFFVVQNSQNRSIRALYTGDSAMSTVRRPSAHRKYLQEVGRQTAIMKLQSYLFFGTITYVEEAARELLEASRWNHNPIRFLVIDFSLVLGVDLSASEAFVRLQRSLALKNVILVLCGFQMDSPIGRALDSVELFNGTNVEVFSDINEAIEWTENVYLKAWFDTVKEEERDSDAKPIALPGKAKVAFSMGVGESWQQSPRRSHIHNVGGRLMRSVLGSGEDSPSSPESRDIPEPAQTLVKTFTGYESDLTPLFFLPILRYFTRVQVSEGEYLWRRGEKADGLYVVESGVLRATYDWDNADVITESMVSGTLAGELSGLANMPRNATVVAEKSSIIWKLDKNHWTRFKEEQPGLAHRFIELVLKVAKNDYDILISACSRR